jgi:hypothetical protein
MIDSGEFENVWVSDDAEKQFSVEYVRKALAVVDVKIREFVTHRFHLPAASCQFFVSRLEPELSQIRWGKTMTEELVAVKAASVPSIPGFKPAPAPLDLNELVAFFKNVRCCVHIH